MPDKSGGIFVAPASLKEKLNLSHENYCNVNSVPWLQVVGRHRSRLLWKEMQSAYRGYVEASEALEHLLSHSSLSLWLPDEQRAGKLIAEQRISFENYIDARLRFGEFQHDQSTAGTQDNAHSQTQSEPRNWIRSVERQLLIAANVALLAITVGFSLYVPREQRHFREQSLANNEEVHAVPNQAPAEKGALAPGLRDSASAAPASAALATLSSLTEERTKQIGGKPVKSAQLAYDTSAKPAARGYYPFKLSPSEQLTQIGSLHLAVTSVDPRRRELTISFLSGRIIVQKRMRLNVPIWINSSPAQRSVKLVATRMDANRVQGYVLESASRKLAVSTPHSRGSARKS